MQSQPSEGRNLTDRIKNLIKIISVDMYEREEIIAVSLLAALSGQNTFLYGPPGTAKSLIARRISCAFEKPAYFEYLMNRFSTPEEVFGPVSIMALKEDRYIRKTEAYLPRADFAFLDEIWKSSPAILNTLLTLINERIFKNGDAVEAAPLKALIAASNETPEANQGLDALYDRFIVRLMVPPIRQQEHFEKLLGNRPSPSAVFVPDDLRVTSEEWVSWAKQIDAITLSSQTLTIINLIRAKLVELAETLKIYVSDRRWQRAAMLVKASAFFNGRSETNHSDALLLQHCLWTEEATRNEVAEVVVNAVKSCGIANPRDLSSTSAEKDALEQEIHSELLHTADVYATEEYKNIEYFVVNTRDLGMNNYVSGNDEILIPYKQFKSLKKFNPFDRCGNAIETFTCSFDGNGVCTIANRYAQAYRFQPTVLFRKGDKKDKVNRRLINDLRKSTSELKRKLIAILDETEEEFSNLEAELSSLFSPLEKTNLAVSGISAQIETVRIQIADCERIDALCG